MSVTIGDASAGDFHQPFADGEISLLTVLGDDDLAGHDLRDQPDVLRVDAHLPVDRRQRDHVHVLGEDGRLRA